MMLKYYVLILRYYNSIRRRCLDGGANSTGMGSYGQGIGELGPSQSIDH